MLSDLITIIEGCHVDHAIFTEGDMHYFTDSNLRLKWQIAMSVSVEVPVPVRHFTFNTSMWHLKTSHIPSTENNDS